MKLQKMHTTLTIIFIIFLIAIGNLYRKSKKPFDTYIPYGIVYDEETGRLFYKGNKVFKFYDRITNNISCFYLDENGTVMIDTTRNKWGILTGIEVEIVR